MFTSDVIKAQNVHVERFYAAFYTLNGKNVNVMLELPFQGLISPLVDWV